MAGGVVSEAEVDVVAASAAVVADDVSVAAADGAADREAER